MRRWLWSVAIALAALIVIVIVAYLTLFSGRSEGTRIGSVSTTFRFFGPNDNVALDRFDDDAVDGVACYLARARKGGIPGAVGTAEDPSEISLSCARTGPIKPKDGKTLADLNGKRVFSERASILFKTVEVRRFYDPERNTLCYVAISTKIINGSPTNAVGCVSTGG
ncbi:MAG: CreA family protein [Stellaceae bacterium]